MTTDLITTEYIDNYTVVNELSITDRPGRMAARGQIDAFQSRLTQVAGDFNERDSINKKGLNEHLIDGVYIRSLFIPKDKIIVSKIWKVERFWIIVSGEVTFKTEMGLQHIKVEPGKPFLKAVPLGSKVVLYTHEDTLWFAISKTSAGKVEDAENDVGTESYEDCIYPWESIEEHKT